MNLIDTHAHLTWPDFKEDFKEVLKRAQGIGVKTVINVGASLKSSQEASNLDCSPLKSYSTIGLHPHEINELVTLESIHKNIEKMEDIREGNPKKIVAIGECGLDYYFGKEDEYLPSSLSKEEVKRRQKDLFQAQIDLAKKINLPLIVHSRDSWEDIFLSSLSSTRGVFHSFTGTKAEAQKVLDLGFYLGFNCTLTYPKNEELREIAKEVSLEKILIETDCPFLPPQRIRGQRNEPANVLEVVKVIAEVKGISLEEVVEVTFQNAKNLFKLS